MKSIKYFLILITLISASIASTTTSADEWIEFTGGTTISSDPEVEQDDRFHIQIGLRALHATDDNTLYSLSYSAGEKFFSGEIGSDEFREVSVGFGRRATYKYAATSYQAGVGLTKYESRSNDDINLFIPLRASIILGRKVGITGSVLLHIEQDNPILGFEFGYALGSFN